MNKIDWPQAAMCAVIVLVAGGLQYSGKLPVEWHPFLTAGMGALLSLMKSAIQSGDAQGS